MLSFSFASLPDRLATHVDYLLPGVVAVPSRADKPPTPAARNPRDAIQGRCGTTIGRSARPYPVVAKSTAHENRNFPFLSCRTHEGSGAPVHALEMNLRKIRQRTACLYPTAAMLPSQARHVTSLDLAHAKKVPAAVRCAWPCARICPLCLHQIRRGMQFGDGQAVLFQAFKKEDDHFRNLP